jgi:hypothetical protein
VKIDLDALDRKACADAQALDGLHGDPSRAGNWIGHRDHARNVVALVARIRELESSLGGLIAECEERTEDPEGGLLLRASRGARERRCDAMSDHEVSWKIVHDEPGRSVRRFPVPGGWLYQCESEMRSVQGNGDRIECNHVGWSNPVFVSAFEADGLRPRTP